MTTPLHLNPSTVLTSTGAPVRETPGQSGSAFVESMGKAIENLDKKHVDADSTAEKLARGEGNLHETALALERADIALRLAVNVRNKVVSAYQEIMRMPV